MKKWLSILLCTVVFACTIGTAYAEDDVTGLKTSDTDQAGCQSEAERVCEATELRTANSETYMLSDGSYECVVYSGNKYYKDENGEYREISNRIVAEDFSEKDTTYDFANEANDTKVYFSDKGLSVLIKSGENELSFTMPLTEKISTEKDQVAAKQTIALEDGAAENTSGEVKVSIGEKCNDYSFEDFELRGENFITYADVLESTDVVYSVGTDNLKEYIVLKDSNVPSKFSFEYDTEDCVIKRNENGTLDVYDPDGVKTFEFGSLFAVDSDGTYTEAVKYDVLDGGEGKTIVTVSVDEAWLYDKERKFPVMVDPSVTLTGADETQDSYVNSQWPNQNYYTSSYIYAGKYVRGVRRTYIRFDLPAYIYAQSICSAELDVYRYSSSGNSGSILAYRATRAWASSTLTWNNKPGYSTAATSTSGNMHSLDGRKCYLDVTSIVKKWYSGTYNNYGFVLKDKTESAVYNMTFYSSDSSPSLKMRPELHIYYTVPNAATYGFDVANLTGDTEEINTYPNAEQANRYLNSIGYHCSLYGTCSANFARSGLCTNAITIIDSHGGSGRICIYDRYGTKTRLSALRSSDNMAYSLEDYFESGTHSMDGTRLVIYAGCCTANTDVNGYCYGNLLEKSAEYGADCAVGFSTELWTGEAKETWYKYLFKKLKTGATVSRALEYAKNKVYNACNHNCWGYDSYVYMGEVAYPGSVTIYPVTHGQ